MTTPVIRAKVWQLRSHDSYYVKGRGQVFVFEAFNMPPELHDPDQLLGEVVSIDQREHLVIGVDSHAVIRSPEQPYRSSFGLLVRTAQSP